MKKIILFALLTVSLQSFVLAQDNVVDKKVHKIVMQFSSADSLQQLGIMTQLKNVQEAWPNAKIEVVCHSGGLDMLVSAKSKVAAQVSALSSQGIAFAACNNTMKRRNVKKEDLLKSAVVVPSAMLEIVTKQEEGWAYLKGGY